MVTIEEVDKFVEKNAKAAGIIEVDIKFYDSLRELLNLAKREVFNDMLKLHREIYEDSDKETRWKNGASELASIHLGPEKDSARAYACKGL